MKSSLIVGALVLAFVFYVTAKGELPAYLGVFFGQVTPGPPVGQTAASAAQSAASTAAPFLGNTALGQASSATAAPFDFSTLSEGPADFSGGSA